MITCRYLTCIAKYVTAQCYRGVVGVQSADLTSGSGNEDEPVEDTTAQAVKPPEGRMKRIFGFEKEDFSSWHRIVCLLNRPTDPAALGIFRCMFGKLLV